MTSPDTINYPSVPPQLRDAVTLIQAAAKKLTDLDVQRTAAHTTLRQVICQARDQIQTDPELPLSCFQCRLVAELLRFPNRYDHLEDLIARAEVFEVSITKQVGSYGLLYDDRGGPARLTLLRLSGPLRVSKKADQIRLPVTVVLNGTVVQVYVWSSPRFQQEREPSESFEFKPGEWIDIILGEKRHSGGTGIEIVIGRRAVLEWIRAFKFIYESQCCLHSYL